MAKEEEQRIAKLEDQVQKLADQVQKLADQVQKLADQVQNLTERLEALEAKSGGKSFLELYSWAVLTKTVPQPKQKFKQAKEVETPPASSTPKQSKKKRDVKKKEVVPTESEDDLSEDSNAPKQKMKKSADSVEHEFTGEGFHKPSTRRREGSCAPLHYAPRHC